MFNNVCRISDAAIKLEQAKTLMGILIEYRDMPVRYQDNIIHLAFDLLGEQEQVLLEVSATLQQLDIGEPGEQKRNKNIQTV